MKKLIALVILIVLTSLIAVSCMPKSMEIATSLEMSEDLREEDCEIFVNSQQEANTIEDWGVLYLFEANDLYGFKDIDGEIIIEPQYYFAHDFSEGLAFVWGVEGREDQTGFIDLTGNLVIPLPTAHTAGDFSEGFAHVSVREWYFDYEQTFIHGLLGPYIFINRAGENVFSQEFLNADSFRHGFSRVLLWNGRVAFIDTTGENAFGMEFKDARDFADGYAKVTLLDGTRTHIDRLGNILDMGDWLLIEG